jgi:diguanylate cyclase (GGDEF)-like protein
VRTKASILIVEDYPEFRQTLSDILKPRGWSIDVAGTGQEALSKAKSGSYDVALVDLRLPDMVGTELFGPLRRLSPRTDIIVLTGFADLESAMEAVNVGAFAYLTKPIQVKQLLSQIEAALRKQAVSKREALLKREYWRRSITDRLTGIYNRRYFDELLLQEIARTERYGRFFALLMVDIDDFKAYNDAHGHLEGDRALQEIASLFKRHGRRTDSLVRYGGEEFVLIMREVKKEEALGLAERLRGSIENAHLEGKKPILRRRLTISIGIAAYPTDATSAEELVARADEALYAAKASGKNKTCLYNAARPQGDLPQDRLEGQTATTPKGSLK